jgi:FtsP/CotA-like multicopper oxidase with cupredoxin domain
LVAWSVAIAQVEVCPDRPPTGGAVTDPIRLHSVNGVLEVDLTMVHSIDAYGISHYCYLYADGSEAPTLVTNPGDRVVLNVTNHLTETSAVAMPASHHHASSSSDPCAGGTMSASSTNVHFHGLNIPPICHQDETIKTLIQPNQTFQYSFQVPANEPPGLYWYHPHTHGFTTTQVTGGAAGALIVEGIEQVKPEAAGLPERVLVLRQFAVAPPPPGTRKPDDSDDAAVISVNFVPAYAKLPPPVITMKPSERQVWRVLNATSIHFVSLQFQVDVVPESMELLALDGVPLASSRTTDTIVLPPAGRAEFIVEGPPEGATGKLVSLAFDTGPDGDYNPFAVLASIVPTVGAAAPANTLPQLEKKAELHRFVGLQAQRPTKKRKLYFSETTDGAGVTTFFITVEGQKPKAFDPEDPPAIVTREGTIEDWTIENRSSEVHAFHIHQIHFLVLAQNGVPVQDKTAQDTIVVPYWDGQSAAYPSVTLRMDFRDPETVGTFMYHCHILDHWDAGMMAKIEVKPKRR